MVKVITTDAREPLDDWNARLAEDFGVADARSLKDERRAESTGRENDHLLSPDGLDGGVTALEFWVGPKLDAYGFLVAVIEQDTRDLMLYEHTEVRMPAVLESRVQICVSRILAPTLAADVAQVALGGVVGVEILDVDPLGPADLFRGIDKAILGNGDVEGALGHLNRPVGTVRLLVTWSLVCFELWKIIVSLIF